MDNSNVCENFEHDLAMLNYFQEEFMFRQKHYWDILIKLFALSIIVTILPITSEVFGISLISIHQRFLLIFPAIGLIISLCSLFLLLGEAKRIRAVNDAKYRINRQYMDEKYQYMFFNKLYYLQKNPR